MNRNIDTRKRYNQNDECPAERAQKELDSQKALHIRKGFKKERRIIDLKSVFESNQVCFIQNDHRIDETNDISSQDDD